MLFLGSFWLQFFQASQLMSVKSTAEWYRVTNLRLEELNLHNDHKVLLLVQSSLESLVHHLLLAWDVITCDPGCGPILFCILVRKFSPQWSLQRAQHFLLVMQQSLGFPVQPEPDSKEYLPNVLMWFEIVTIQTFRKKYWSYIYKYWSIE